MPQPAKPFVEDWEVANEQIDQNDDSSTAKVPHASKAQNVSVKNKFKPAKKVPDTFAEDLPPESTERAMLVSKKPSYASNKEFEMKNSSSSNQTAKISKNASSPPMQVSKESPIHAFGLAEDQIPLASRGPFFIPQDGISMADPPMSALASKQNSEIELESPYFGGPKAENTVPVIENQSLDKPVVSLNIGIKRPARTTAPGPLQMAAPTDKIVFIEEREEEKRDLKPFSSKKTAAQEDPSKPLTSPPKELQEDNHQNGQRMDTNNSKTETPERIAEFGRILSTSFCLSLLKACTLILILFCIAVLDLVHELRITTASNEAVSAALDVYNLQSSVAYTESMIYLAVLYQNKSWMYKGTCCLLTTGKDAFLSTREGLLTDLNTVESNSKSATELSAIFYSLDQTEFSKFKSNLLFNNTCAALTEAKLSVFGSLSGTVLPSTTSLLPKTNCSQIQLLTSGASIVIQFMLNYADNVLKELDIRADKDSYMHQVLESENFKQMSEATKHLIDSFGILGKIMSLSQQEFYQNSVVTTCLILAALLLFALIESIYFFRTFLSDAEFDEHRSQHLLRYWSDMTLRANKRTLSQLLKHKIVQTTDQVM